MSQLAGILMIAAPFATAFVYSCVTSYAKETVIGVVVIVNGCLWVGADLCVITGGCSL
jgi:hypothetical protein